MNHLLRFALSLCSGALGVGLMLGGVLVMNRGDLREADKVDAGGVEMVSVAPKPKPQSVRPAPKPKPRAKRAADNGPAPLIGGGLAGLSFGLDGLEPNEVADEASALMGDRSEVVMTGESVDEAPVAVEQVPPKWPESARKRGVNGVVVMSLLVGVDGRVSEVRVLESRPPGVFDGAALEAVRQWRFQAAQYQGQPVAVRVTQPLEFNLEGQ